MKNEELRMKNEECCLEKTPVGVNYDSKNVLFSNNSICTIIAAILITDRTKNNNPDGGKLMAI